MKTLSGTWRKWTAVTLLALATGAAQAHTGHTTVGFVEGVAHPFGMDHLLAMVAVGVWSVCALPSQRAWWGPAMFLLVLVASAALGTTGFAVPYLEHAIALSVVGFGLMLVFARRGVHMSGGLGLVALAAALHGLAHGAEAPDSGFAGYAAGFLLTTAALHLSGIFIALGIQRFVSRHKQWVVAGLGAVYSGTGMYLLQQL